MIVYRMLDDGGFVAGDTDTKRTSYAYRTSLYAIRAKLHDGMAQRMAQAEMMETVERVGIGGSA